MNSWLMQIVPRRWQPTQVAAAERSKKHRVFRLLPFFIINIVKNASREGGSHIPRSSVYLYEAASSVGAYPLSPHCTALSVSVRGTRPLMDLNTTRWIGKREVTDPESKRAVHADAYAPFPPHSAELT